jgi:hypothetical protein
VKQGTILVIGAGASYGARAGTHPPPLGAELGEYLLGWLKLESEAGGAHDWPDCLFDSKLEGVIKKARKRRRCASGTNFERAMEKLLKRQERATLQGVNRLIAAALLGGEKREFASRPDRYDQLLEALRGELRGIITPNYDLLAEEALARVGLSYRYRALSVAEPNAVVIDKFHGSVNWFHPAGGGVGSTIDIARQNSAPTKVVDQAHLLSHYNDRPLDTFARTGAIDALKRGRSPVLVTYGPGKDAVVDRPTLDRIRSECRTDLEDDPPGLLIAVGISPPRGGGDDDAWESLCECFRNLKCRKEYWSGDEQQRQAMETYGFSGRHGWLPELVTDAESVRAGIDRNPGGHSGGHDPSPGGDELA